MRVCSSQVLEKVTTHCSFSKDEKQVGDRGPGAAGQEPLCADGQLRPVVSSACTAVTACCAACAQRSDFNIITKDSSFPVSIWLFPRNTDSSGEKLQNPLSARCVC